MRINRYMLECKYRMDSIQQFVEYELIDTCWNVNERMRMSLLATNAN